MCLIVLSLRNHPEYPLIFAGNRDEFHGRPTASARFWKDDPNLLAGRDLKAGGTWLGVTRGGRFATVTNFREPGEVRPGARSRGELVTAFLQGDADGRSFLEEVHSRAAAYNGFNLLVGDAREIYYLSNRNGGPHALAAGVYGLSNGWLDTPWPKVRRAKSLFRSLLEDENVGVDALLDLLHDDWRPPDEQIPRTGLELSTERKASAIFIADSTYGTRASTVVLMDRRGRVTFAERSFGPRGEHRGMETFTFEADS